MSEERVIPTLWVKKSTLLLLLGPKEKTGFIVAKTSCRMTECALLHTKSGPSSVQSPPCSYKLSLVCTFPTRFQSSLCPPPPPLYTSVLICVFVIPCSFRNFVRTLTTFCINSSPFCETVPQVKFL